MDQIKLKHNQSITIIGIPMDTNYSVEEDDYTFDGICLCVRFRISDRHSRLYTWPQQ